MYRAYLTGIIGVIATVVALASRPYRRLSNRLAEAPPPGPGPGEAEVPAVDATAAGPESGEKDAARA